MKEQMMKEQIDVFAERNFMVRVQFFTFARGTARCYAEAWLTQQHPFGYSIDYFDTLGSAHAAIAGDDATRHDEMGFKHEYIIYELKVCE